MCTVSADVCVARAQAEIGLLKQSESVAMKCFRDLLYSSSERIRPLVTSESGLQELDVDKMSQEVASVAAHLQVRAMYGGCTCHVGGGVHAMYGGGVHATFVAGATNVMDVHARVCL